MTRGAGRPRRVSSDAPNLNRVRQKLARGRRGIDESAPKDRSGDRPRIPQPRTFRDVVAMPGSVVTVQLGQCGNQVGAELFDTLSAEIDAHPPRDRAGIRRAFFREPHRDEHDADVSGASTSYMAPVARAVLIDMEPKVVQASLRRARRTGRWRYDGDRTLAFQSGSGNNWARGYHTYGDAVRHDVLDLVAKEAEACDHVGGFMLMQSMAGGTGAGLGARVAEALRDEYPTATLMNHCVWPYESGEVIVQAYNTLLTLSSLLDSSDGVTVVQNEELHQTCVKLLGVERPTFGDMNAVAASQLAGVLLPAAPVAQACQHLLDRSLVLRHHRHQRQETRAKAPYACVGVLEHEDEVARHHRVAPLGQVGQRLHRKHLHLVDLVLGERHDRLQHHGVPRQAHPRQRLDDFETHLGYRVLHQRQDPPHD